MSEEKPETWEYCCYASDESGRSDFYGQLVIVAVYLNQKILKNLQKEEYYSEIKDSKNCSDSWINKCAPKIMEILGDNYECSTLKHKEFNKLHIEYKNMDLIIGTLHNDAHLKLFNKVKEDGLRVIDRYIWKTADPIKQHYQYLKKANAKAIKVDVICKEAESKYLACALASIIARYYFLKQMDEMSQKYELKLPFGSRYYGKQSIVAPFKQLTTKLPAEEICKTNFTKCFKKIEKIFNEDLVEKNCNKCPNFLVFKQKKDGNKFICCIKFPHCEYVQFEMDKEKLLEKLCPICTAPLAKRTNKEDQTTFIGCSGYPKCEYVKTKNKRCPLCGDETIRKKKGQKYILYCSSENCKYREKMPIKNTLKNN